jgi:hypothetical protein
VGYLTHEDMRDRDTLVQAIVSGVSGLFSSGFKLMGTHQHQPIGTRVQLGVLRDVPIWHPRAHNAERKQCLRNGDDGEYIGMGNGFVLRTDNLVWSASSTPLVKIIVM